MLGALRELRLSAVQDYEMAQWMLGRQSSLDFLESSAWPATSRALELNLWSLSRSKDACEAWSDGALAAVLDPASASASPAGARPRLRPPPHPAAAAWPRPTAAEPGRRRPPAGEAQVLVLATHTAFALECATMAQAALGDLPGLRLSVHGVTTRQTCHLANACAELESAEVTVARFVEAWLLRWRDADAGDSLAAASAAGHYGSPEAAAAELRAALPAAAPRATALVCGALWFLCWLVREALGHESGPPMLHILDASITMFVPVTWQRESLQALRQMAAGGRGGRDAVACFQSLAAAQIHYRVGRQVPWLPTASVYAWCLDDLAEVGAPAQPAQPLRWRPSRPEFLVTRSYFWRQRGGEVLRALISRFGRQLGGVAMQLHWMESCSIRIGW